MSNHRLPGFIALMILFITGLAFPALSQTDTCWSVLLVKKGKKLVVRKNMSTFNAHGFYLCKDKLYDFRLVTG